MITWQYLGVCNIYSLHNIAAASREYFVPELPFTSSSSADVLGIYTSQDNSIAYMNTICTGTSASVAVARYLVYTVSPYVSLDC